MNYRIILVIFLMIAIAESLSHSQAKPAKFDLRPYIVGRIMKVNKCYKIMDDPDTIFKFDTNKLTIQSCNTYECLYSVNG